MWQYRLHVVVNRLDNAIPSGVKRAVKRLVPGLINRFYLRLTLMAPDRPTDVTVQSGPLAGRAFRCSLRDARPYFLGNYEPETVGYLTEALRPGDTVLDVGGHVGYLALVMASLVGASGQVVVYEPDTRNLEGLRANLALNPDLGARVRVRQMAISDRVGEVVFLAGPSWTGQIDLNAREGDRRVPTSTIDAEVSDLGLAPALIMMDIEGAETAAFRAMAGVVAARRPVLLVEVHDPPAHAALVDLLGRFDYVARQLDPPGDWSQSPPWSDRAQYAARPRDDRVS